VKFKEINPGSPFLFKLKYPINAIAYLDTNDGVCRECIPQAQLEIVFECGYPETTVLFKQNNTEICKKTIK